MKTILKLLLVLFLCSTCSPSTDEDVVVINVTYNIIPANGGSVSESPSGSIVKGSVVTLTAIPSTGFVFKEWKGDVTGTTNPVIVVNFSGNNITVVFEKDTDGDGVMDNVDICSDTPSGESVDSNGCSDSQKDTDGDGVTDDIDTCPDTPSGESVNSNGCSSDQEPSEKQELKILFIGSSYFIYNYLPDMFYELVKNSGKEVYIDSYMRGGLRLADHASSSITANKIKERKWDIIVLQGIGHPMAYPDYYTYKPVYPAITSLKEKILNNSASTKIIYCMPWALEDGMTWKDWPDTYEDMQIKIYDRTLQYADEIGFTIAPVGWVWYKVLENKGYPLHYLHLRDRNHPSVKGSYIMACVIYSTIYENSTINNSFFSKLSESEASYFQEISSSTVLNDTDLWKITP